MNNNNENQNLNMGTNLGNMGPTPQNQMPMTPEQISPVRNEAETLGQMPNLQQPGMSQMIEPTPINNPMVQPIIENNGIIPPQTSGVQPEVNMNLAPEGIITPPPVAQPVQNNVVEPLMSSAITEGTVLNQAPQGPINNGVPVQNMANPMSQNMGTIPPANNNIGMMNGIPVPPAMPTGNEKQKPKMNKTLLFLLIVILIAAVGFGVYYFLFLGKNKQPAVTISTIMPEELEVGNDIIVDSAATYVKVTGMNIDSCKVESNLNPKKVGSYEYTITCGTKVVGPNKVTVKDTVAPIATAKNVVILPGDSIYPDDFIDTVVDATECTYEFVTDTSEIDLNTPGEYEIEIKVLDAYENETTVSSKLIIDENAPQEYLYCEGVGTSSETYENAKIYQTYKYGISGTGNIYNMLKIITYKFDTLEDYELALENIDENTFDENEGKIGLDPERFTITVTQVTDENTLSTEFNLTPFPKTSLEMEEYHNGKEELCYTDIE